MTGALGSTQEQHGTAPRAELVVVPDAEELAREAARRFTALARDSAGSRGRFSAALSGGSTPTALYRLLAQEPARSAIPWARVHLFWADERCVPPDDPGSNYRLACETLIAHVAIPARNVHRIRGELAPEAAARACDRELRRFFHGPRPRFDLVLLGLGRDGHTASLFPGSGALEEAARLAIATTATYAGRPTARVTLTLPALNSAWRILFLVSGEDKAEIIRAALKDTDRHLPAQRVVLDAGQLTWLVDAAAAALIGNPGAAADRLSAPGFQAGGSNDLRPTPGRSR